MCTHKLQNNRQQSPNMLYTRQQQQQTLNMLYTRQQQQQTTVPQHVVHKTTTTDNSPPTCCAQDNNNRQQSPNMLCTRQQQQHSQVKLWGTQCFGHEKVLLFEYTQFNCRQFKLGTRKRLCETSILIHRSNIANR